jgi:hypothetical protein
VEEEALPVELAGVGAAQVPALGQAAAAQVDELLGGGMAALDLAVALDGAARHQAAHESLGTATVPSGRGPA